VSTGPTEPPRDARRFAAEVCARSWGWLQTLGARLSVPVDVQIASQQHEPLLDRGPSSVTDVAAIITGGGAELRQTMDRVLATRRPQHLRTGRVQITCLPLALGGPPVGTLTLAMRNPPFTEQLDQVRSELELIGTWLAAAVEAHLGASSASGSALGRASSFLRILQDVEGEGSDRQLVATFADTLAVWHDLEVLGYVQTASGAFVREVTLAGADSARTPDLIEAHAAPERRVLSPLEAIEAEHLGFVSARAVAAARLGTGAGAWLIVLEGDLEACDDAALALYVALLGDAVRRVAGSRAGRAGAEIARMLLEGDGPPEALARRAMDGLRAEAGASAAALTVTAATGVPFVRVMSVEPGRDAVDQSETSIEHLVAVRRAPTRYTLRMGLSAADRRGLTFQEHRVAGAYADVLESWVRGALGHDAGERRREVPEAFATALERAAALALERGQAATLLVLASAEARFDLGITHEHVARLRGLVRSGDLVGLVADDEVAVLLPGVSAEQASPVIDRLRALLADADSAMPPSLRVGAATRTTTLGSVGDFVQDARQSILGAPEP
jgi:hypothetical protein